MQNAQLPRRYKDRLGSHTYFIIYNERAKRALSMILLLGALLVAFSAALLLRAESSLNVIVNDGPAGPFLSLALIGVILLVSAIAVSLTYPFYVAGTAEGIVKLSLFGKHVTAWEQFSLEVRVINEAEATGTGTLLLTDKRTGRPLFIRSVPHVRSVAQTCMGRIKKHREQYAEECQRIIKD